MKSTTQLKKLIPAPTMLAISLRNLSRNRARTFLSALGIIIGVFAICSLGMAGAAFTVSINDMLEENACMLFITSTSDKNDTGGLPFIIPLTEDDIAKIESATKAVTTDYDIVKIQYGHRTVSFNHDEMKTTLLCGDKGKTPQIIGGKLIEGKLPRLDTDIVVLSNFAQEHNLRIGSHLKTISADGEELTLRVTGIVGETIVSRAMSLVFGSNLILGTNELYNTLVGQASGLYTFASVQLYDRNLQTPVKNAIERKMNGKPYKVSDNTVDARSTEELLKEVKDILSMAVVVGVAISAIALLVASISITNIMIIAVKERTPEIGIMRAVGTFRRQIVRIFLYEAGFIGLFGAMIGVALSCIIVPVLLYFLLGSVSAMMLPSVWMYIPLGLVIGVTICTLAGLYPAIKASQMNPVEAMEKAR